jgi:pimeloyl-ACP methyl ester carboxylesterase
MVELNREQYGAALMGPRQLAQIIYPQVMAMRANPEHFLQRVEAQASSEEERALLNNPEYRATLISTVTEAVTRSLDGWASDSLAFTRPWGFEPQWISIPTLLWHGTYDVFSPVAHARWLAERIQGAVLMLSDRGSHSSAAAMQIGAIRWLVDGGRLDSAPVNLPSEEVPAE